MTGERSPAPGRRRRAPRPALDVALIAVGFAAALAIRSLFLFWMRDHNNLLSWRIVVGVLEGGADLYADTHHRYNYSPLWAGVLWLLSGARRAGWTLNQAVAVFLVVVDAATAALLARIVWRRTASRVRALASALLFFANPVSAIVSGSLGAFDNFAFFFVLLSVAFAEERPAARGKAIAAMSLSLLVKHVAFFHPLLLARSREEPRVGPLGALVPYAVFLASFLPFWASRAAIREHVFGYEGSGEPYGIEPLRFVSFLPPWTPRAVFVAAGIAAVVCLRRVAFGRACLLLTLVTLLFLPGVGPNYFVWPIALGALEPGVGYAVYTAVVTLFLIHSPDAIGVEFSHLPGWSGPWWAIVFWVLWEIREEQRRRAVPATQSPAAAGESAAG